MVQLSLPPGIEKRIARRRDARDFARLWPQIDSVEGLLAPGQEEWLFRMARALPDGARIVEIGSFKGRSTVCLGLGCKETRRHVYAIDRFQGSYKDLDGYDELKPTFEEGFFETWSANVRRNGIDQWVTPLVGNSLEVASHWRAPIHLLWIDGSHEYEDVLADFKAFYPWVVYGGVIALHDVTHTWDGPTRVWNEHVCIRLKETGRVGSLAFGKKRELPSDAPFI
jgi:predicted O-methyltransferase YrrM